MDDILGSMIQLQKMHPCGCIDISSVYIIYLRLNINERQYLIGGASSVLNEHTGCETAVL
ncbi:hypothetical protein HMPREF1475_01112 [Hoylesella oralis HGA0225]|nr:hypothetical protein HMPREF1475_01112 [Hoylesella oralis HGA0225]SHF95065.1 hypothetical protein SAMN05444288_1932 [Hoylesella oralis]